MPLHDSFHRDHRQKKADEAFLQNLSVGSPPPSRKDLTFVMSRASQSAPEPQVVKWRSSENATNQLQVVYRGDIPTWRLTTIDNEGQSSVRWTLVTDDPEQIYLQLLKRTAAAEGISQGTNEQPGSPRLAGPVPGSLFLGRYQIHESIARGGMGQIFRAEDLKMQRPVAVKALHVHLLEDDTAKQRFEREMQVCTHFRHPNVVCVYDYGYSPEGVPYMVMEYLDGHTLYQHVRDNGTLSIPDFVRILVQICGALRQAHDDHIIHRDVKPQNIMLVKHGEHEYVPKLLDFGVAKALGHTTVTKAGDVVGSLFYMSPEQCTNMPMDGRSDIYSLGCVMYETLAGVIPFHGESTAATMMMHLQYNPQPFSAVRRDLYVPEHLEWIIRKSLEKQPDRRFQSANELLDALRQFAWQHPQLRQMRIF